MSYPAGPPEWPEPSLIVDKKKLRKQVLDIPAGTFLIRAYSHGMGFSSDSFNPTRASLNDATSGGRFDGTDTDPFHYTYAAVPFDKPHVAFWETFQNDVSYGHPSGGGRYGVVLKSDLEQRSFAYLEVLQPLKLLKLHSLNDVSRFHTNLKVLRGDDRLRTRAWAQFIRAHIGRKIHGFTYTSAVLGDRKSGDAIILFRDRCKPGTFLRTNPPEIPMNSAAGSLLVDAALSGMNIRRAL